MGTYAKNIIVRQAIRTDLPQILQLYSELVEAYSDSHSKVIAEEAIWHVLMDDSRQHLLVAEVCGKVIGTLTVIIIPNIGHGCRPWAAVENVIVDGTCRGLGVGTRLMAEATEFCRSLDCYKIVLSSNLVRQDAHRFYRRLGWQQSHIGFSLKL